MFVAEAFTPCSPSKAVCLDHAHRAKALVYALHDLSHTILPDLALRSYHCRNSLESIT